MQEMDMSLNMSNAISETSDWLWEILVIIWGT
jgi:hypothetical protein